VHRLNIQTSCRYCLVIEKEATFQGLADSGFFRRLECMIVTAKGFPDLATRAFLRRLTDLYPDMLMLGIVDWYRTERALVPVRMS